MVGTVSGRVAQIPRGDRRNGGSRDIACGSGLGIAPLVARTAGRFFAGDRLGQVGTSERKHEPKRERGRVRGEAVSFRE